MAKIVNAALKAKAWTFEAKAKATGAKAKAKAKAKTIKIGLEAPRGQGLASRTTSLPFLYFPSEGSDISIAYSRSGGKAWTILCATSAVIVCVACGYSVTVHDGYKHTVFACCEGNVCVWGYEGKWVAWRSFAREALYGVCFIWDNTAWLTFPQAHRGQPGCLTALRLVVTHRGVLDQPIASPAGDNEPSNPLPQWTHTTSSQAT